VPSHDKNQGSIRTILLSIKTITPSYRFTSLKHSKSQSPPNIPVTRWVDDVRKDIQKLKVPNWKTLVQNRGRWKELVEKAKTP